MNQNRDREAIPVGRFSSDIQKEGDSIRRQNNSFLKVCQRWDLSPSKRWKIFDRGMSGYHGAHLSPKAELGKFLTALQSNQVQSDHMGRLPVLVWESVDRMTRLPQMVANNLVRQLVDAGVSIVFDEADLWIDKVSIEDKWMILQGLIDSSYLYSRRLSRRQKSVWDGKREEIRSDHPIRMRRPSWINYDMQNHKFELNAGANAIKYIFEQTVEGVGQRRLVHKLQLNFRPIGTSGNWNGSFVQSLLNDRTVLGEFQPHQLDTNGKRVPIGNPIIGYYPAVIDEGLWYRAQSTKIRRTKLKGPITNFINLFTGLIFNGNDSHAMHIQTTRANRAGRTHVQRRLVSYGGKNKVAGSCPVSINYYDFEKAVLMRLMELRDADLNDQDSKHLVRLGEAEEELAGLKKRLRELQIVVEDENLGTIKALAASMAKLERRQDILINEINNIRTQLSLSKNLNDSKLEFDAFSNDVIKGSSSIYSSFTKERFYTKAQTAAINKPALVNILAARSEMKTSLLLDYRDRINRLVERITVWPLKNQKKVGFVAQITLHGGATRSISYYSGRYQSMLHRLGEKADPNQDFQSLIVNLKKYFDEKAEPELKQEIIADTLGNAAQIWLAQIRSKMTSQSFRVIPSKIKRFVSHLGVDLDPSEINKGRWDQWVLWLRGEVDCNRLKIATARVCYSRSRELVHWLQEQGRIAKIEGLDLSAARAFALETD